MPSLRASFVVRTLALVAAITAPTAAFAQITFASPDNATFTATTPGVFTFVATGEPSPVFSTQQPLPSGLSLSMSGILSGTPAPGTAGVYSLTVRASNGVNPDATQAFTLTVNRAAQTIFFPNPGQSQTLMGFGLAASASSALPVTIESMTPTVCTISGQPGQQGASTHVRGTCTLVARQAGNAGTYLPAPDVMQSFAVIRRPQQITFSNPGPRYPHQDVALAGFASPGLRPLTFTSETPLICPQTHPAQVRVERKGTCTVTARVPEDEVFEPVAPVTHSFEVLPIPQVISFTNPGQQVLGRGPVPLVVRTTIVGSQLPGLLATLTSSTPSVCTISARNAVLLTLGTCTIVASQAGDEDFDPAPDVTQSFSVVLGTPSAPVGIAAQVNGNFVTVSWNPATTGAVADGYLVEVGDGPGRTSITSVLTPVTSDRGLLPQGEYYLRVRAVNAAGMSPPSEDVWVRVLGTEPVALPPLGPNATVDGTTVSFRWTPAAAAEPADRYLVQVGTDLLSGEVARVEIPAGTTSFTVPNVPAGTYALRVRAITEAGPSAPSPAVWLRVGPAPACSGAPAAPSMLTPVVGNGAISLSWLPPANGAAESFAVHAGTQTGSSNLASIDLGPVAGVGASVGAGEYFVRTASVNQCGVSAASLEQTLRVGGAVPDAPTNLVVSHAAGSVTFSWTGATTGAPASHFVVEAGVTPGTSALKFPVTGSSSLTVPNVPSGVTFVARVRGANASGVGAASTEIVVTVP